MILQMQPLRIKIYRFYCIELMHGNGNKSYRDIARDFQDAYDLDEDDVCVQSIIKHFIRMRAIIRKEKPIIKNLIEKWQH